MRNNWVDWAKAIGILLVVMGHSSYDNPAFEKVIYFIHMPLFFFISGYLFKLGDSNRVFLTKIWGGLCIPYILYNLIFALYHLVYTVYQYYAAGVWPETLGDRWADTVFGLTTGGILAVPTWFLLALAWCKVLCVLFHRSSSWLSLLLIPILAILMIVRLKTGYNYPFAIDSAITGMIWFEAGFLCRKYLHFKMPVYFWYVIIPVCIVIFYFLVLGITGRPDYMGMNPKGIVGLIASGVALTGFIGACMLLKNVHSRFIVIVSKATIVIMSLHMLFHPLRWRIEIFNANDTMTFIGDVLVVIILAASYPLLSRKFPALTGGRR